MLLRQVKHLTEEDVIVQSPPNFYEIENVDNRWGILTLFYTYETEKEYVALEANCKNLTTGELKTFKFIETDFVQIMM